MMLVLLKYFIHFIHYEIVLFFLFFFSSQFLIKKNLISIGYYSQIPRIL